MTTSEISIPRLSDAEHRVQLRRAVVAGTVGTIIEAYDFLLYVQVAPLVFAKLYFPSSDPLVGTLQAFGIYAVGFVSRPVGAALRACVENGRNTIREFLALLISSPDELAVFAAGTPAARNSSPQRSSVM